MPQTVSPEERRRMARARTHTPSGGYRLKAPNGKGDKGSAADAEKHSAKVIADRKKQERLLGRE